MIITHASAECRLLNTSHYESHVLVLLVSGLVTVTMVTKQLNMVRAHVWFYYNNINSNCGN